MPEASSRRSNRVGGRSELHKVYSYILIWLRIGFKDVAPIFVYLPYDKIDTSGTGNSGRTIRCDFRSGAGQLVHSRTV